MQQQTNRHSLSLRENRLTGSHCQITDITAYYTTGLGNSAPPAAPRDPCSSSDNIRLPDIIYVYILSRCSRSRHHSFLFLGFFLFLVFFCLFVCLFVVAYCTQLLSQAMYNLIMATTMAETCSC